MSRNRVALGPMLGGSVSGAPRGAASMAASGKQGDVVVYRSPGLHCGVAWLHIYKRILHGRIECTDSTEYS